MAYDKTREACSVVEKLKTLETTLSNKFSALTDQVNKLSAKISKESSISTIDANSQAPGQAPSNLQYLLNLPPQWLPHSCLKRKKKKSANSM